MAVVCGGYGRFGVSDGICSGHGQAVALQSIRRPHVIAVVGAEDSVNIQFTPFLVKQGHKVGIELGIANNSLAIITIGIIEVEKDMFVGLVVVCVNTYAAFKLHPVGRLEEQRALAKEAVLHVAVGVLVDVEVGVHVEVAVPVVEGVVACCILLVPVLLQALHVNLTARPLEQRDHRVVAAVALADKVVAVGVGVVGVGLHPDHLVEFYLRVDHTAEALLVGVGHGTRLSAVGERSTHVGSVADRGDADHVVLRDTRLEEVTDVVGPRYPFGSLAVAVELRSLDADVEAGTP